MTISEQPIRDSSAVNRSTQATDGKLDDQKKSDKFSELLKKDDKDKKEPKDLPKDLPKGKTDMEPASTLPLPSAAELPLAPGREATSVGPENVGSKDVPKDPHITSLITELGHQIDVMKMNGKTNAVNMTFNSNTLQGLHVQIRRQEGGEVSIRFVTQSDSVSKLLAQHTDQLRETLSQKGMNIKNISISNAVNGSAFERRGHYGQG